LKYWRGYLTAAIFGIITWVLMAFGSRFTTLVDMVYPYVIRTAQTMLAEWSSGVDFLLWQLGAIVLLVLALASLVLMIILKWNPIQWFGWVLAACTFVYMIHTAVFGLNYYAGPLPDDIRMEIATYNADELEEAAIYYRDHANALADQVNRDEDGNVKFSDFKTLANQAGDGFRVLTYQYSYSVFAGSTLPVKELGWADMYTSMGITGLTMGITGEAAVNPQIPDVCLPFTMCHEMAHRMCIAQERDANFAGFLAASVNPSIEFQYSAYFMAYRYCYNALASANSTNAAAAAARVASGAHSLLKRDLNYYNTFFSDNRNETATKVAATANNTYIAASGDPAGTVSYDRVVDLLVNWHIEQVVLPSLTEEEKPFDPLDESQVDLSGIVNAR
jgi:hypothetical protein